MRAAVRTAIVLALGVGLVLGAVHLPGWHIRMAGSGPASGSASGSASANAAVNPAARPVSRSALVCPGPETVGVKRVDASSSLVPTNVRAAAAPSDLLSDVLSSSSNVGAATTGSMDGTAIGGSGPLALPSLLGPGSTSTQTSAARSVLLTGNGAAAPGLVAAQTSLLTTGDLRGLSTAACQAPSAETWLVGGGSQTGRRGRVILTNPTPNAVTVDLDVFGAKGALTASAARGIVVGAHRRAVVLLDAIAPGERSPFVHVIASGGVIAATLYDTYLDGTTPAGSDDVVGTTPGRQLVVPGVTAAGTPGSTILRLAATTSAAVVKLRVLTATGPTAAPVTNGSVTNGQVKVAAHTVKDVDLSTLPAGYDGIEITSSAPVVAGVQLRPGVATPGVKRDLAWTAAEPAITGLTGFPLGATGLPWSSALALTAAGTAGADAALDLVFVAADGTETTQQVTVTAGTAKTVSVPLTAVSVWLRPRSGAVNAAFVTAYADPAGTLLSVAPLVDAPLRFTPVAVHPLAG